MVASGPVSGSGGGGRTLIPRLSVRGPFCGPRGYQIRSTDQVGLPKTPTLPLNNPAITYTNRIRENYFSARKGNLQVLRERSISWRRACLSSRSNVLRGTPPDYRRCLIVNGGQEPDLRAGGDLRRV